MFDPPRLDLFCSIGLRSSYRYDLGSDRQVAYGSDITYGTNNEFGFDYLRDNMVIYKEKLVQRELNYAIVDEVDSILIDEARTPLIISGKGDKSTEMYRIADDFVSRLREGEDRDFIKDEKKKTVHLTEIGQEKAEKAFNIENLSDIENTELNHHILVALKANNLMKRDVDYVVKDDKVIIVDEFTGRIMTGRRYSDGLHQAIEAKERVKVERESKTLATITFQNYFRMYAKISGMTGTAKTEEDEFRSIYALDVVTIPTHMPMIRKDLNDAIFSSERGKYMATVEEIIKHHETGQPVLVGTVSVEKSELLSSMLAKRGLRHEVLNAKFHEKEAEIVSQAGKLGQVTIATNMAGRGTDILLGGNPEFLARSRMRREGYDEAVIEAATGFDENAPEDVKAARKVYQQYHADFKRETDMEHEKVVQTGGLHIIGTERHESRRIDNQLRGRAGRQGDPGSSQFFISVQDDLLRIYGAERLQGIMSKGMEEDEALEFGLMTKQIENAQKRMEARNFEIRKSVLQYDDVMNKQREIIYAQRRSVLGGEDMRGAIMDMIGGYVDALLDNFCPESAQSYEWNIEGLIAEISQTLTPIELAYTQDAQDALTRGDLKRDIVERLEAAYGLVEVKMEEAHADMREIERVVLLSHVDRKWMDHIDEMDQLRDGIGLQAIGHRDPIVEYRLAGFDMFDQMIHEIQQNTLRNLYMYKFAEIKEPPQRKQVVQETNARHGGEAKKPRKTEKKVGRNDPCPCGSGKKYKNCCGRG